MDIFLISVEFPSQEKQKRIPEKTIRRRSGTLNDRNDDKNKTCAQIVETPKQRKMTASKKRRGML